ncbi:MAG: hypothetical protein JXB47_01910 [Anaerolineae bacterium]|nr:hypothetical protein [Anaerolineae bacterium]
MEKRHFHPSLPAFVPYMVEPGGATLAAMIAENAALALPAYVDGEDDSR